MNLPDFSQQTARLKYTGDPYLDAMHDGFCELDAEGSIIRVNAAFCRLIDYEAEEILGASLPYPFWPEEEVETLKALFFSPIVQGQSHLITFVQKNGTRKSVMVSPSVITDDDGNMVSFFAVVKDVTELMLSRRRKRMLSLVADKTTDAVIVAGPDYRIIWVNDAFCRLTGHTLEEVIGKVPGRFLQGPKTSVETRRVIKEHLHRRESVAVEILNYAKDGTEYWLDLNINPVFDENGDLEFFIAVERDITAKKEAEYALQLAYAQLEEVQLIAKMGYWELEYETGRITMSDSCYEIYGIERSGFNGTIRSMMHYVHIDDTQIVRNALNDALDTGNYDIVYRVKRDDGRVRFVQERGLIVQDPVHNCKVLRVTAQDVDAAVRARMDRETMNEIRQVIDTSPVVHFKLQMHEDGNIRFAYVSESIEKIDGRLNAALLMRGRQNPLSVLGKSQFEAVVLRLTDAAEKGEVVQMELLIDSDKGPLHVEFFAEPEVSADARLVWYGHLQDVTTTFQRNLELERLVTVTETQNQRLLDFAQILSHNVRLHSSTMEGLIHAIDETDDAEEREMYQGYLKETSDKLDDTLRDLNAVLTIRSGTDRDLETLDVAEVLGKEAARWKTQIAEVGGRLLMKVRPGVKAVGSAPVLVSMLDELVQNAIRFRSDERPLRLEISARFDVRKRTVVIAVEDNGRGFELPRNEGYLFGMYRTFHDGLSGKGLGLFLAKNKAEAMEADLVLTRASDKGCCFTVLCRA